MAHSEGGSPRSRRGRRVALAVAVAVGINGALAGGLLAESGRGHGPSPVVIKALDDCDPASFNQALNDPTACVGDGDTTFQQLVDEVLATHNAKKWRFSKTHRKVKAGRDLLIRNKGGEFHTFSEVAEFGGGCVPELNALMGGLTPVPECAPEAAPGVPLVFTTTGVGPGQKLTVTGLGKGTHRFECLIHPWMRSTIKVR